MITISTLQSQIALNRRNLAFLENSVREVVNDIKDLECRISECKDEHKEQYIKNIQPSFDNNYKDLTRGKKWIKKYAKLQRALKSELAYRIMYNREMRYNNMEQYQLK